MPDRRIQNAALAVVLVALVFGGWGLYEVGKSRGMQAGLNARQVAPVPARDATPSAASAGAVEPDATAQDDSSAEGLAASPGADGDIVHATRTGKRYHREGCRFLSKSDIPMSRSEAESKGLTPCGVCQP